MRYPELTPNRDNFPEQFLKLPIFMRPENEQLKDGQHEHGQHAAYIREYDDADCRCHDWGEI